MIKSLINIKHHSFYNKNKNLIIEKMVHIFADTNIFDLNFQNLHLKYYYKIKNDPDRNKYNENNNYKIIIKKPKELIESDPINIIQNTLFEIRKFQKELCDHSDMIKDDDSINSRKNSYCNVSVCGKSINSEDSINYEEVLDYVNDHHIDPNHQLIFKIDE